MDGHLAVRTPSARLSRAKIKDALRRLTTRTRDAFDVAVATAMAAISPNDVRAWTEYAGYSLSPL